MLTRDERAKMTPPRRENRQLSVEGDIVGRVAAWLPQESGTIPPKSPIS